MYYKNVSSTKKCWKYYSYQNVTAGFNWDAVRQIKVCLSFLYTYSCCFFFFFLIIIKIIYLAAKWPKNAIKKSAFHTAFFIAKYKNIFKKNCIVLRANGS